MPGPRTNMSDKLRVLFDGVLAEFIHSATVRGLGHGRTRRLYHYEEVREFLEALAF